MRVPVESCEVIAPNFKKRLSGVTSTIIRLVMLQRQKGVSIASLSPKGALPEDVPSLSWWALVKLWQRPRLNLSAQGGSTPSFRVWHARRNIEMVVGILFRDVLRMKLRLVFTSAAQRHHHSFTRFLIRRMDKVIATSARSGSFLRVPHQVIMHGVDLAHFHPPHNNEDNFSNHQLGRELGAYYAIGCFGRLRRQKGTDLFVDAMITLLPHYPRWVALISGRTTPEHQLFVDELKQRIKIAGLEKRIIFLGEVADITIWYRRLTLYVAPSRNEGFGLTPLEAMACQTAVVASDAGVYAEIINADCGTIVPAGNGAALTCAIGDFMADPEKAKMAGLQALAHVSSVFPLDREADAIADVYAELFHSTS